MTITAAEHGQQLENIIAHIGSLLQKPALRDSGIPDRLNKDLADFKQRGFLTIAFVGEYSAGKSSIISALTGRRDLAISADIATDACKEYLWNGVHLIDTPGLWTERKDHDQKTYDAIERADLLVYCLTYSLFDTTTLANFMNLAFERNYQSKMLLLVNKMSAEAGDVDERIRHYTTSLSESLKPQDLTKFPLAFCDARDQLDGQDENDDELKALSRFDQLNDILNNFIEAKGAMARLDTPIRMTLSALDAVTEKCSRDDGKDDQQAHLVRKLTGVVARERRALSIKAEGEISRLVYEVERIGSDLAQGMGVNPNLESEINHSQSQIETLCHQTTETLQKDFQAAVESLTSEMGKEFETPLMNDYLDISIDKSKTAHANTTEISAALKKNVDMFKRIADTVGISANKALDTASRASKIGLADGIRTVGKFVGFKFKPWQAVNWSKNLTKAVPYIDILFSILSLASDVASEVEEAENDEKIRTAKRDLINHFQNVAASVGVDMRKAASEATTEIFGQVEQLLTEMKTSHENELGLTNEIIREVGVLRSQCDSLLKAI